MPTTSSITIANSHQRRRAASAPVSPAVVQDYADHGSGGFPARSFALKEIVELAARTLLRAHNVGHGFVILDLEYLRMGLIRIDAFDQALVALRETINEAK